MRIRDDPLFQGASKSPEQSPTELLETGLDTAIDTTTSTNALSPTLSTPQFSRRRSSIRPASSACSRRSSISSLQSHHSTVSAHGCPQSPHIAQHLRRASIIESRKARLADRAAHGEKVRLRAAIAKATSKPSYFEERALAAQAAREKLLAEITARCEEKVRRAKKIAEENKERKAAEHARLKEEMAERLAEAARRRTLYQQSTRRGRSGTQTASDMPKTSNSDRKSCEPEEAVKAVQRAWRSKRQARAVTEFRSLNISASSNAAMSFEELGKLLSEDRVLTTTAKLLGLLGLVEAADSNGQEKRGSTRIFLSSYLITSHPQHLLSHGGNDLAEKQLVEKASDLIKGFEQYLDRSMSLPRTTTHIYGIVKDTLCSLFAEFSSVFHAWKANDSSGLVQIMVNQFVELDLILLSVKDDHSGGVSEDYANAIRQNQVQILARLKKFAGSEEALTMVKAAVRKARKAKAAEKRRKSSQNTPRTVTDAESMLIDQLATPSDSTAKSPPAASPEWTAKSLSVAFQRAMTPIPSNREVAHEIQINGFFEIAQSTWTSPRRQFMETVCAEMRQALKEGGRETAAEWTHSMAIMIREKLMSLVSPRHFLYDRIDQILDVQLIRQSSRAGLFSYDDFFASIANIIAQICSQGRDEVVKEFAQDTSGDVIDRLLKLVDILDLMTLDHVNFGFRAATPLIVERGPEHEHAAFESDLSTGVHHLSNMMQFWREASNGHVDDNSTPPSSLSKYTKSLSTLILSPTNSLRFFKLPETLRLDYHRLLSLRASALRVAATAAILLTMKIRLRRDRETQWRLDAERLGGLKWEDLEVSKLMGVLESLHLLPEGVRDGVRQFASKVLPSAKAAAQNANAVQATLESVRIEGGDVSKEMGALESDDGAGAEGKLQDDTPTEQVALVILKALRENVYNRLSTVPIQERIIRPGQSWTTPSSQEGLARVGIGEFGKETDELVEGLARVRGVDWRAHGEWWEEVDRKVGEAERTRPGAQAQN
ncbi:MAG: hypothetical protein Q9227_000757 [Pyrenula ochraceoflavens]